MKLNFDLYYLFFNVIRSRFYVFVDDDYYVSTRNLLRFLRNPLNYPGYLGIYNLIYVSILSTLINVMYC